MLRAEWERQERAWRKFHEWEAQEPPCDRAADRLIADLGAILDGFPAEERLRDPDPAKLGVRRMIEALSKLRTPR